MKTHNTDGVHQIDVTRGRKNTNRAGSRGIDVLDGDGTEVSPVTSVLFPEATVTDGDDGVAIVRFGGGVTVVGEVEPSVAAAVTISSGADHRAFPGVAWLDTDEPHAVGHRILIVCRHGATHLTGGKIVGKIATITSITDWTFTLGSEFDIEDVANDLRPQGDPLSVLDIDGAGDYRAVVWANEFDGTNNISPHFLVCDDPAETMTSASTWTRTNVAGTLSGHTQDAANGRLHKLSDGTFMAAAQYVTGGVVHTVVISSSTIAGLATPTLVEITTSGYNECDFEEVSDGTLIAHLRNAAQTFHYSSTSTDYGATWSTPVQLFAAMGYPAWRLLVSGIGLTVYRQLTTQDTAWRQTPAGATDQGWGDETVLDSSGSHNEYATILQLDDNHVLVVWAQAATGGADPVDCDIYSQVFEDSSVIGSAIAGITVQDEGTALSTLATSLNFVGDGVTASGTGSTKTITFSAEAAGHYEVIVSGTAPPVAVTNSAEDDWVYGFVPG